MNLDVDTREYKVKQTQNLLKWRSLIYKDSMLYCLHFKPIPQNLKKKKKLLLFKVRLNMIVWKLEYAIKWEIRCIKVCSQEANAFKSWREDIPFTEVSKFTSLHLVVYDEIVPIMVIKHP